MLRWESGDVTRWVCPSLYGKQYVGYHEILISVDSIPMSPRMGQWLSLTFFVLKMNPPSANSSTEIIRLTASSTSTPL